VKVCRNTFDALGGGDTSYLETDAYLEEHGAGNAPEQAIVTDCLKGAANYALSIRSERQISGDRHMKVCKYLCLPCWWNRAMRVYGQAQCGCCVLENRRELLLMAMDVCRPLSMISMYRGGYGEAVVNKVAPPTCSRVTSQCHQAQRHL